MAFSISAMLFDHQLYQVPKWRRVLIVLTELIKKSFITSLNCGVILIIYESSFFTLVYFWISAQFLLSAYLWVSPYLLRHCNVWLYCLQIIPGDFWPLYKLSRSYPHLPCFDSHPKVDVSQFYCLWLWLLSRAENPHCQPQLERFPWLSHGSSSYI